MGRCGAQASMHPEASTPWTPSCCTQVGYHEQWACPFREPAGCDKGRRQVGTLLDIATIHGVPTPTSPMRLIREPGHLPSPVPSHTHVAGHVIRNDLGRHQIDGRVAGAAWRSAVSVAGSRPSPGDSVADRGHPPSTPCPAWSCPFAVLNWCAGGTVRHAWSVHRLHLGAGESRSAPLA
jgi:hypothetical protein